MITDTYADLKLLFKVHEIFLEGEGSNECLKILL